eukprot:SAG31_NODE_40519_length_280_cov_0.856354_1_plen_46_part_10
MTAGPQPHIATTADCQYWIQVSRTKFRTRRGISVDVGEITICAQLY